MSQSPDEAVFDERSTEYRQSWVRLLELLGRGGSLSGREANCCYLNTGISATEQSARFVDISGVSGFGFPDDARGLATVDWDYDGDLDVWVTNRSGPQVRFLRNNHDSSNRFLSIRLQGRTCNRDAVGARVAIDLQDATQPTLIQTVKTGEGYLSQSSQWLHFGLGQAQQIKQVRVRWPGETRYQVITNIRPNARYLIIQGQTDPVRQAIRPADVKLDADRTPPRGTVDSRRVVVVGRFPLPPLAVASDDGSTIDLQLTSGKPMLLNLWASWCPPCLAEMHEWSVHGTRFSEAGLDVVLLCVDRLRDAPNGATGSAKSTVNPFFRRMYLTQDGAEFLDEYLAELQRDYHRPLGVPTSLLVDRSGQLAVLYRGRVAAEQILDDVALLDAPTSDLLAKATQLGNNWMNPPRRPSPLEFAGRLRNDGKLAQTESYLRHVIGLPEIDADNPQAIHSTTRGGAAFALGSILFESRRWTDSIEANRIAAKYLPNDERPHLNLGSTFLKLGQPQTAVKHYTAALAIRDDRDSIYVNRAIAHQQIGNIDSAIADLESALRLNPQNDQARRSVAMISFAQANDRRATTHFRALLRRNPQSIDAIAALAWILATSHDDRVRDGAESKLLAEDWCRRTAFRDPKALNALAAAHAELGEFDDAIQRIERAIELARGQTDETLIPMYRARLELFRKQMPVRRDTVSNGPQ